ncbi:MAG: hypothetical protein HQL11_03170 [Candidatus Omnitrophica bacterium]|nr:hypothetical protein [Candidatus Omnitrophota bacterium]
MAKENNESARDRLEKVRGRLKILNKRIKSYSILHNPAYRTQDILRYRQHESRNAAKEVRLEDIRDKLKAINQYLLEKAAGEASKVKKADKIAQKIVVEPEPEVVESGEKESGYDLPDTAKQSRQKTEDRLGLGLDLGTAYLGAAREVEQSHVFVKHERNAFLSVRSDAATKQLLERLKIKYVAMKPQMYVLGNIALDLANIFNRDIQRSMSQGILNPSEAESVPILKLLVEHILWKPRREKEICCFSVPAKPVDRDMDTIYHRGVFEGILKSIGFTPVIIDEGYAVVLSEMESSNFTGIGVSCGGGMVNVCAAYKSVPILSFSVTRGGDWIDKKAADALNLSVGQVTSMKEQGINIASPDGREAEALAIYYRNYIKYFLEAISRRLGQGASTPQFREPVPVVFAGGSAMAGGFIDVVREEMADVEMGIEISEVRVADEPFTSVARGRLFHAINVELES